MSARSEPEWRRWRRCQRCDHGARNHFRYRSSLLIHRQSRMSHLQDWARCAAASRAMDDSSPTREQRPAHRPPAPPAAGAGAAFDNHAYQPDEEAARVAAVQNDANHNLTANNESFGANGTANGSSRHESDRKEPYEAVNLELINLAPKNGHARDIPPKKDVEVDLNSTNPYDEYFVPVNEHKKYIRGEKLYVTADKRKQGGCRRRLCWTIGVLLLLGAILIAVLAATGVIFTNSATPVNEYNNSISSARALGGVGAAFDHSHERDAHQHHDEHEHEGGEPTESAPSVINIHDSRSEQAGSGEDRTAPVDRDRAAGVAKDHDRAAGVAKDHDRAAVVAIDHDRAAVVANNDIYMYVPRTVEGVLKIDNDQLHPALRDETSTAYRQFTNTLSQAIAKAVFDDQLTNSDNDIRVEIVNLRSGSVIVTYRIHWIPKTINASSDPITPDTLRSRLSNYLDRNSRMLNVYHVAEDRMDTKRVLDVCQDDKDGCEYGCEFDSALLDFKCTCPSDRVLDMNHPKKCVYSMDNSLYDPTTTENAGERGYRVLNVGEDNQRPQHSTPGTEYINNSSEVVDTFDWINSELSKTEPTTIKSLDIENSHVFGRPNGEVLVDSLPKWEPSPEPTSEPEPESTAPTSEPSPEPPAEPQPEPNAEPNYHIIFKGLATEHTTEHEPTFELKYEPAPEPEPTSESKPDPTAEPEPISETNSQSITELVSEPKPEPTSEETIEPALSSESEVEPTSEPTSEPEPSSEPKTEQDRERTMETTIEPRAETYISVRMFEPVSNPVSEQITEPELAASEPKAEPTTESEPQPEPLTESQTTSESTVELTTKSVSKLSAQFETDSQETTEIEEISEPKTDSTGESDLSPSAEVVDQKVISLAESVYRHNSAKATNITIESTNKSDNNNSTSIHDLSNSGEMKSRTESEDTTTESSKVKSVIIIGANEYNHMSFNNVEKIEFTTANYMPDHESSEINSSADSSDLLKTGFEYPSAPRTELPITEMSSTSEEDSGEPAMKISIKDEKTENNTILTSTPDSRKEITFISTVDQFENETGEIRINTKSGETTEQYLEHLSSKGSINSVSKEDTTTENDPHQRFDEGRNLKYVTSKQHTRNSLAPFTNSVETTTPLEMDYSNSSNVTVNSISSFNDLTQNKGMKFANDKINETENEPNSEKFLIQQSEGEETLNTNEKTKVGESSNENDTVIETSEVVTNSAATTLITTTSPPNVPISKSVMPEIQTSDTTDNFGWLSSANEQENETEESMTDLPVLEIDVNNEDNMDTDYLSNSADKPQYGILTDYDTASNRDKRVQESNPTESATETTSEKPTEKMLRDYIYNSVNRTQYDADEDIQQAHTVNKAMEEQEMSSKEENMNKEPAPVWEHGEIEPEQVFYNHEDTGIDTTTSETATKSQPTTPFSLLSMETVSNNSTENSRLNVTVYEIPSNLTTLKKLEHSSERKSDPEEHDAEMNPFLPEIENNRSLVKKLHEGQDIESTNINETQNEHIEEPSLEDQSKEHKMVNTTISLSSSSEYSQSDENIQGTRNSGGKTGNMRTEENSKSRENESGNTMSQSTNANNETNVTVISTPATSEESSKLLTSTFLNDTSDLVNSKESSSTEDTMNLQFQSTGDASITDQPLDVHSTTQKAASSIHDLLEMELKTNAPMIDQHFSEGVEFTLKDPLSVIPIKSTKKLEKKPTNDFHQKKNDKNSKLQENTFNDISDDSENTRTLHYSNYNPSSNSE